MNMAVRDFHDIKAVRPVWISKDIRTMIRQRRAFFKREGRSHNWWRIKKKTSAVIKERRDRYHKEKKRENCSEWIEIISSSA